MRSLFFAALLLSASSAPAQIISVYGTFADPHFSNLVNGSSGNVTTGYSQTTTSHFTPGFGVGATFGVLPVGPIRLGFDVRGSFKPGNDGSLLVLAGPKLSVKVPFLGIKPYIQASGGYLRTQTTIVNGPLPVSTQDTAHFAAWEILGGIDYRLLPFLDLRVIEFGGGKAYNDFGVGGDPDVSLFTINTGLVLHF